MSPCSGCGKNKSATTVRRVVPASGGVSMAKTKQMDDNNYVLVTYNHPNRGSHKVIGPVTGKFYGYRGGGSRFYVDKRDVAKNSFGLFQPVTQSVQPVQPVQEQEQPEQPKQPETSHSLPHEVEDDFSVYRVPGITGSIANQLKESGYHNYSDLVGLSEEQLLEIKGIGVSRAKAIVAYVDMVEKQRAEIEKEKEQQQQQE